MIKLGVLVSALTTWCSVVRRFAFAFAAAAAAGAAFAAGAQTNFVQDGKFKFPLDTLTTSEVWKQQNTGYHSRYYGNNFSNGDYAPKAAPDAHHDARVLGTLVERLVRLVGRNAVANRYGSDARPHVHEEFLFDCD